MTDHPLPEEQESFPADSFAAANLPLAEEALPDDVPLAEAHPVVVADGPAESARSRRWRLDPTSILIGVLLIIVMVSGAYFRFVGQNWDDFTHLHPDERFLTGVISSLTPVSGISEYFDTDVSGLNPNNRGSGFYVYGTLPLLTVKAAAGILSDVSGDYSWTTYNGAHLVGRTVSALADLLSIFFLFLIGRRLYDRWIGLLAAALYAWAVLPIQLSHFWTMDAFTTAMVVITFWFAVRVLDEGRWLNYLGFGVFFGAAMASRINVVPLAGLIVLAAGVRLWPISGIGYSPNRRQAILIREVGGLIVAGLTSILIFRVAQPYAFKTPALDPETLFMPINPAWWDQMKQVSGQVSGHVDFPPNHQWTSRIPYLFSWQNIVLWGMGLPLGLLAWSSWIGAGVRILRARSGWERHLLPVAWILVYYGWQGGGWVMSMRYYLPLYPFLILLAAWGLVTLVRGAYKAFRERASVGYGLGLAASGVLLVTVTAFTLLWAYGFTRIYTRQLTRVNASQWILQNVPADYSFTIEGADGASRLVNIGLSNDLVTHDSDLVANATRYYEDGVVRSGRFTAPIGGQVTGISATYLGDPLQDSAEETLWVGLWDVADGLSLGEGTVTADFSTGDSPLGQGYEILLDDPVTLQAGRDYELRTRADAGAPIIVAGTAIATEGPWDDPIPWKVCGPEDGAAWSPDTPPLPGLVRAGMFADGLQNAALNMCAGVDGFGMGYYQGLELFMASEDNEQKRSTMLEVLNNTDYLTISSNRFYDTLSRLPMRFPMSNRYYDALFAGELGFELEQTFESTFTFGDRVISDQVLPTHNLPNWLNEFEVEEAFHVYDHPVVFVFRKTADYDPAAMEEFLYGMDLATSSDPGVWGDGTRVVNVVPWTGPEASEAPTALMFTDDVWDIQRAGGTWSAMFDVESLLNRSPLLTVIAWWALLIVIGWVVWPTLFTLFPALSDRAYPVAKIAGLMVVSWLAWLGASVRLRTWSREGLLLAMGLVLLLSLTLGWRRRAELLAYIRENWRAMLGMEALTLALFGAFLLVRLGNPDLWHPNFGGERPMDFAYLNGVLRSTVFPPINPWYSGGYINYYYYGFVLAGTPIKILGIVPSVGFNLILATWFALTGMGAFSVAYNLVGSWRRRGKSGALGLAYGNPWLAGVVAMLLAVVLGNLDDIRLIITALARTGGWRPVTGEEFLPSLGTIFSGLGNLLGGQPLNFSTHWWYWNPTRVMAHTGNAITEIPYFTYLYGDPHAHAFAMPLTLLVVNWALHEILVIGHAVKRRWFEAALALVSGSLTVGVLRMTNFADWLTYLVLGLFALTLAVYLWHRNQRGGLFAVEDDRSIVEPRRGWRVLGLFGGVGVFYAWDAFTRLHLTRATVLRWTGQVIAFAGLSMLLVAPFNYWYATADALPKFWEGARTPLWAYLDLNGLFLFMIISLLFWDTARWLRDVPVRRLVGRPGLVLMTLFGLAWLVVAVILALLLGYATAVIALPVIFWATILFFRPGQSAVLRFVWAVVVLCVALTVVVDVIVWAGDIGRQNTVFKFYLQVWLMLSTVGGAAFAWVWQSSTRWRGWTQALWRTGAVILLVIAGMYPVLATQAKFIDRMSHDAPHTLDGAAFMPYATQGEVGEWFSLEEDYHMIRWLQDNVTGSPVVLEGRSEREYLWGSRVAVYTGLPTLVGFNFHQRQQRTLDPLSRVVQQRVANTNWLYNTADVDAAWRMLGEYEVAYIVVGQLERAYYTTEGLAKFQQMVELNWLDLVYEDGGTRVYAVRDR